MATENAAVWPAVTARLTGCVLIDGDTAAAGAALTVRVALALVTLPAELVTMALKRAPLSEVVVAGVVYEDDVAPEMAVVFLYH